MSYSFVTAARQLLHEDTYKMLLERAQELRSSAVDAPESAGSCK